MGLFPFEDQSVTRKQVITDRICDRKESSPMPVMYNRVKRNKDYYVNLCIFLYVLLCILNFYNVFVLIHVSWVPKTREHSPQKADSPSFGQEIPSLFFTEV